MNKFVKGALAVGGGAVAAEGLRMALKTTGHQPRYEPWERQPYKDFPNRVLILGGGFAGFKAAQTLCKMLRDRDDIGVMVISKENFFTFWPMIASVISSDMATKNVAQPLRRGLIELGASFRRAAVQSIDLEKQVVTVRGDLAGEREFPYDHLIMALGGEPAYFGIPGVEEHAISMTGIGTAEDIRNRMIERYEEVSLSGGEVVDSKLTFAIIGGGATGVETASELHELVHVTLAPDYPNINPHKVRIILLDRNEEILKELDPALRRTARRKLADLQIEVMNEGLSQRDNGGPGDPRRRPRDTGGERDLDRRCPRQREARRHRPSLRRAQGPEGRRLHAGRGLRQRLGCRGLRGERR